MLCFWGAQVREGLGLVKPDQVKHGNGIRSVCPKTAVQDMSAGRSFAGFIRDGKVSVLRLRCEGYNHDGKLSMIHQIILLMAFEFLGGAQITLCVCVCVCVAGVVRVGSVQSLSYVRCFIGFTFAFEIDHVQKGWKVGGTVTRLALCNV